MAYSIIDSGNTSKRQAIGSFDLLADQERYRNEQNRAIDQQQKASTDSAIGSAAGAAATLGVKSSAAQAARVAAGQVPIVESAIVGGSEFVAPAAANASVAGMEAGMAAHTGAAVAATAAETAAASAAATGTAAAETAAIANPGTMTALASNPVGWAAAAGLLAVSLFR